MAWIEQPRNKAMKFKPQILWKLKPPNRRRAISPAPKPFASLFPACRAGILLVFDAQGNSMLRSSARALLVAGRIPAGVQKRMANQPKK
jgi:hypothetical protein